MTKESKTHPFGTSNGTTMGHKNEILSFILLAFIGLPIVMVGAISAYGFLVWFLQIMFFGPPS